ncbi:MAG: RIP metalloprotease RseP [Bacteroidetes bacterium]|nr:RIP metalloprotease RseP [Bacteroidota bacterium]
MEILVKAVSLIMSLSILVLLHEMGHFIPARLFKTKVEKFYLFFDPWFSLFKFKKGDTEYGIGWLPFGGYVKIAGMIDESMDKEAMKEPAKPWEFRSKPAWQRLIIMLGGVTVNALLAWAIYSMSLFTWGQEYLPNENVTYGVACDSLMYDYGFKDGDKIIMVDTMHPKDVRDISKIIMLDEARKITIEREGKQSVIVLPDDFHKIMMGRKEETPLFEPRIPFVIDSILKDDHSLAQKSGLKKKDKIVGINNISTPFYQDFSAQIHQFKNQTVNLQVIRGNDSVVVACGVDSAGKLGLSPVGDYTQYFKTEKRQYTFMESIPAGYNSAVGTLNGYVKGFKLLASKEGMSKVGSFGTLGSLFPESFSEEHYWEKFWAITALLSVILAFMNLLPIPALDGGHVMFLLFEIILRRKPSEKFMEYAQIGGMILLFGLMALALFNDAAKFLF